MQRVKWSYSNSAGLICVAYFHSLHFAKSAAAKPKWILNGPWVAFS
jgi:hypothetical protein